MPKRAIIICALVDESEEKDNRELEKEIFVVLSKKIYSIPWAKEILAVKVEKSNENCFE